MFRDSCEIVSAKSGNTVLYLHYSEINSFCVPSRSSLENSFFLKMNDFSQLCQNYIVTTNERYLFIARNVEDVLLYSRGQKKHKIYKKISVEVYLLTHKIGTKNRSSNLMI